jgi:hypothetical protein
MQIGNNEVYELNGIKAILSNLEIDADGSPFAYAPEDSGLKGLDYLANAGSPGNWWGIATESDGTPYIQSSALGDPAPGYYVSTTALEDPTYGEDNPLHYVNSSTIPFVVIPANPEFGIELGDVGFGFNLQTGDSTSFVVADVGPSNQFGEASIAFANNLMVDSNAKSGGTDKKIILYIFFVGSKTTWPLSNYQILSDAFNHLLKFGGLSALKTHLPNLDWGKF